MSKTEALIAKALSSDSEDEAIACLRMARKHHASGAKEAPSASPPNIEADKWRLKAETLYAQLIQSRAQLHAAQAEASSWKTLFMQNRVELVKTHTKSGVHFSYPVAAMIIILIIVGLLL